MNLLVLNNKYSVYKFLDISDLPGWIYFSDFYSITRTKDEVSVVAVQNESIPESITCNKEWRIIKIIGPLDFSLIGIIAEISIILAENRIPIITISTYETDYFLVKQRDLDSAIDALKKQGYNISTENFDQV